MGKAWHGREARSKRVWYCPYFLSEVKMKLRCEGMTFEYEDADRFWRHIKTYCASLSGWSSCPIAKELNKMYEERR